MSDHPARRTSDPMAYIARMARARAKPVRKAMTARDLEKLPELNMVAVQSMALAGCNDAQIAGMLGIRLDVFKDIIANTKGVAAAIDGWRRGGEAAILMTIHYLVTKKDARDNPDPDIAMLKWASINRLGWTGRGQEDEIPEEQRFIVETRPKMSETEWALTFKTGPIIDGTVSDPE